MDIDKVIELQEEIRTGFLGSSDEVCGFTIAALEELQQYRQIGTFDEIKDKIAELERWHTAKINEKIRNPFANTSTLICHNCDHKDEYIEELESRIAEYEKIGTVERFAALEAQMKPHVTDGTCCPKRNCNKCDKYRKELEKYHEIGTVDECRAAREKQIPKEPKRIYKKYGKHKWKRKENGEIDEMAWDFDYHNGVICEICCKAICVCCNPDYDELEDCEEEYFLCPNCGKKHYTKTIYCDCGQALKWED